MARKPRIEYAGAAYHVMSRGDHGEAIFGDDLDRERFLRTLGETCERTGWRVHAYVLMSNHYHGLIETPEGNLVVGMKWLQGTYTQRYNGRHGIRGHLFQGRYKAVPVDMEEEGCLERMATYIHLNPMRAGVVVPGGRGLEAYRWSSYGEYLKKPGKRPEWLETRRVLSALGLADTSRGRWGYREYMESRAEALGNEQEKAAAETGWKGIRRGWYVGGEEFRDRLLDNLQGVMRGKRRESYSGAEVEAHDERAAERWLRVGMKALGMEEGALVSGRKGKLEKCLLAWLMKKRTVVSNDWITRQLRMGHPSNIPTYVRVMETSGDSRVVRLRKRLEILKYED